MSKTTNIYGLYDPQEPDLMMYVGKGRGADPAVAHWRNFLKTGRAVSGRLRRWFEKLEADGVKPQFRILETVPLSDWEAAEKKWIAYWRERNLDLCNVLDGGNQWPIDVTSLGGRNGAHATIEKWAGTPEKEKWNSDGGRALAERRKNDPVLDKIIRDGGRNGGRKNVESGHLASLNHKRWHVRRGVINPECQLCRPEFFDVWESAHAA